MTVSEQKRDEIEEALYGAHLAADQYLNKPRPMSEKLLKMSVFEALHLLESLKDDLADDSRLENYKLHIFVPLQLHQLIEMRKETKNAE
jgi:hypothetical protein